MLYLAQLLMAQDQTERGTGQLQEYCQQTEAVPTGIILVVAIQHHVMPAAELLVQAEKREAENLTDHQQDQTQMTDLPTVLLHPDLTHQVLQAVVVVVVAEAQEVAAGINLKTIYTY